MAERKSFESVSFPDAMKTLRQAMGGISQEKLARAMDVSMRTVSRYEDESYPPTPDKLLILIELALSVQRVDLAKAFQSRLFGGLAAQSNAIVSEMNTVQKKIEALGVAARELRTPLETWLTDDVPKPSSASPTYPSDTEIAAQIDEMNNLCDEIARWDARRELKVAAEMVQTVLKDMRACIAIPLVLDESHGRGAKKIPVTKKKKNEK